MNYGTGLFETKRDVVCTGAVALSDVGIEDEMHITPAEDDCESNGKVLLVLKNIADFKIKSSIAEEGHRISTDYSHAKFEVPIQEILVDLPQLGESDTSHGIKTALDRFPETIVISSITHGTAEDVIWEFLGRWSKSETFIIAFAKRVVSSLLCIQLMGGS